MAVTALAPATLGTPTSQVLAATVRCLARWGLAKTTLDDIAREAGVSRATVYRLFPGGRDVVVRAAFAAEVADVEAALAERLAHATTTEDRLVVLVTGLVDTLRNHPALQYLLEHEPEQVVPHLAFDRLDTVLATAADRLAAWLDDDARAGEWLARVVVSYAFNPSPHVDLADEDDARRFVRTFLLPGFEGRNRHG